MLLLVEKSTEREFCFVVVQTDPLGGLKYHNASPTVAPPLVMFRSCLVLEGVPKKHALDDVFLGAAERDELELRRCIRHHAKQRLIVNHDAGEAARMPRLGVQHVGSLK